MADTIYNYSKPTGKPVSLADINQMFSDFQNWKRNNQFLPRLLGSCARPFPCPKEDSFPYGFPVSPRSYGRNINEPYATDVGGIFKDPGTGLYCAINLYSTGLVNTGEIGDSGPETGSNDGSGGWQQKAWELTGNMLSLSYDMVRWLPFSIFVDSKDYPLTHPAFNGEHKDLNVTGVFIDRLNLFGQGVNYLIVTADAYMYNGVAGNSLVFLATPDIFTKPEVIGVVPPSQYKGNNGDCSDGRLYYDPTAKALLMVAQDTGGLPFFRVKTSGSNISLSLLSEYTPPDSSGIRIECPGFIQIKDEVTGKLIPVVTFSKQTNGGFQCAVSGTWDGTTFKQTGMVKQITYGITEYAGTFADPLQQDGTGGTDLGCDIGIFSVGAFGWTIFNSNPMPSWVTQTGPLGGLNMPSEVHVRNGEIFLAPVKKVFDYLPSYYPPRKISGNDDFLPSETATKRIVSPNTVAFRATITDSVVGNVIDFGSANDANFIQNHVKLFSSFIKKDDSETHLQNLFKQNKPLILASTALSGGFSEINLGGGNWVFSSELGLQSMPVPLSTGADMLAIFDGNSVYIWDMIKGIQSMNYTGRTAYNQIAEITHPKGSISSGGNELNEYWMG